MRELKAEQIILDELIETISQVEEGNMNHLDAVIKMREKKSLLEKAMEAIADFEAENREKIELEAKEYNNEYHGHKFEFRNGRTMYNYKGIPEWLEAENQRKAVEEKYKAMLKAKLKGMDYANVTQEGEELPLPEVKYGKGSLIVKTLR